ncbi:MAG: tetratricopeptide repeat protein [Gemmatales bacterium]
MWHASFLLLLVTLPQQDDLRGFLTKAQRADEAGNYQEAKKILDTAVKIEPKSPAIYSLRGAVHFKLGKIPESLADFDQQIVLKPSDAPAHWRRGLTLYYAEKFVEGVAQFTTSDKAEPEDVENAVWHLLCNARVKGLEAARKEMLKVNQDSRVPMMEVYKLFAGNSTIEKVMAAAEAGSPMTAEKQSRLFYAHLYCGLFAEMNQQPDRSSELISQAVKKYPIKHYMMNVAEVHLKLRKR